MINNIANNWPLVLAQKPDITVMQNDSGEEVSFQGRNDAVMLDKKVSRPSAYFWEKGKLINIYA